MLPIAIRHFFGRWHERMTELPDPRNPTLCTYSIHHLVSLGLAMFCGQSGSRRQLRQDRRSPEFLANLNILTGEQAEAVAHTDTMNYLMELMPPEGLEGFLQGNVRDLIRSRALERFRFDGDYLVAIDGTRLFTYTDKQHCDACLHAEHKKTGKTTYFHEVLEAKLVCPDGLAISLATAFIENSGAYDKQECELKTFYNQLALKLKSAYPRLQICLLLDGLYANEKVLRICRENGWSYFIVLKEGSIPNLYAEAKRLAHAYHNCCEQDSFTYTWAHNLKHGKEVTHAIFAENEAQKQAGKEFGFLTDRRPGPGNVRKLINKGGRQRWKIENQGFNTQKTGGFELEHDYGRKGFAWKNYYYLIQVAHMLMQLMLYTDLFGKLTGKLAGMTSPGADMPKTALAFYKTITNFARRIMETLRTRRMTELSRDLDFPRTIQIRFAAFDST